MLHAQISQHRNGNIFHNPIKNSEAPDYHEIVKRPIDLKTIKARVKDGHIANSLEYQRDIYLMFANAMMYNVPGSDVYAMAEDVSTVIFAWTNADLVADDAGKRRSYIFLPSDGGTGSSHVNDDVKSTHIPKTQLQYCYFISTRVLYVVDLKPRMI